MDTMIADSDLIQMTIEVNDAKVAKHVKALLKQISAVKSIRTKRVKSEVELSMEEARKGNLKTWNSVDDYFQSILAK